MHVIVLRTDRLQQPVHVTFQTTLQVPCSCCAGVLWAQRLAVDSRQVLQQRDRMRSERLRDLPVRQHVTETLTFEYLMLPSRWLTVLCSRSSSSTQGAGSAVVARVLSAAFSSNRRFLQDFGRVDLMCGTRRANLRAHTAVLPSRSVSMPCQCCAGSAGPRPPNLVLSRPRQAPMPGPCRHPRLL